MGILPKEKRESLEDFMKEKFKNVTPEERNHVVYDNKLFDFTGMETLSLDCMRILIAVIANVKMDEEPSLNFKIKANDIAKLYGLKNAKNLCKSERAEKICDKFFDAELINVKEKYYKLRIVQKVAFEKGYYYMKFSEEFTEFIFNLQNNFSQPVLSSFKELSTTNSYLFWMLICSKLYHSVFDVTKTTTVELSIDEILYFTGNHKKKTMQKYNHLKQKLLLPALKEYIANFHLQNIEIEEVKNGKKVEKIKLKLIGKFCKLKAE